MGHDAARGPSVDAKNPLTRSGSTRIVHKCVIKKLRARLRMWDTIGFTDKTAPFKDVVLANVGSPNVPAVIDRKSGGGGRGSGALTVSSRTSGEQL
ncbi:hypothetical protein TrLO_g7953 [Triparma laevis f. longispina]|uniref:Uncharacterized protein n=1 Tax=Triparma laevis f. longispina TaxID=1714387 RepID=A0A9W7FJW4_9STRA|nr:hypothetical protein TrLO_g7953 [Triparma laevis f. longispina]